MPSPATSNRQPAILRLLPFKRHLASLLPAAAVLSFCEPPRRIGPCLAAVLLALATLAPGCARRHYGLADARPPAEAARPLPPGQDSVRGAAAGRHYATRGAVAHLLLGAHYRAVWAAPVTAPVLDLARAAPDGGPLRPGKAGGGFQSITLNLTDTAGRPYVLRALDKDPRRVLPPWLRYTFVLNLVRDATSAANPYAALVVPPLADALGLPAAHPRLVYVRPDDAALGPENSPRFRGRLALLEEKHHGPAAARALPAPAADLLDSEKMLAQVYASSTARLDQKAYLHARLLDVLLGDWDRHEGQWNWAARPGPAPGSTVFQAIPKDRDQVFFRFDDGALPWLAARTVARNLQTFGARYGNVRGLVNQARFMDERGLPACTRADFARAAAALQARLPDTLLARAVRRFPPAVYAREGPRTLAALRVRREALPAAAAVFCTALARHPVLAGTAQAEAFTVQQFADSLTVRIGSGPNSGPAAPFFSRTFYPAETHQITLEGLGGDDVFTVLPPPDGRRPARIRLRLRGGAGHNTLAAGSGRRRILFDDGHGARPPKRPYERLNDD